MKLAGAEAVRYFAKPDPARAGLLICGADGMRVALRRQQVVAALIGPDGDAELRLTRIPASDLRKDRTALTDALRATGFFPGPRVVHLEDANDGLADPVRAALADWRPGDAVLVVTAGDLRRSSPLLTVFQAHANALAAVLYDDPPGPQEIADLLRAAGLATPDRDAAAALEQLARDLDPGDFRQTLEKIALYKHGDPEPLTPTDIAACAPATQETEVDDLIAAVAEARTDDIAPLLQRLTGQGVGAVTICIGATRHFRTLHAIAADGSHAQVFGPRRDAQMRQARGWGMLRLETALALLLDTDLSLRSSSRAPAMAVMERCLLRLAMLARP